VCSETIGIDSNARSGSSEARGAGTIGQAVKSPLAACEVFLTNGEIACFLGPRPCRPTVRSKA
jgi:hypothetical protein